LIIFSKRADRPYEKFRFFKTFIHKNFELISFKAFRLAKYLHLLAFITKNYSKALWTFLGIKYFDVEQCDIANEKGLISPQPTSSTFCL